MKIDELQERMQDSLAANESLTARAEAEKRDLTSEEAKQFDDNLAAFADAQANIDRLNALASQQATLTKGAGRLSKPDQPAEVTTEDTPAAPTSRNLSGARQVKVTGGEGYFTPKTGGFRNLGEFAYHVARASREGGMVDPRLERLASATTYSNETTGADGGYAVPPDFRTEIYVAIQGEDSLLSRCDQVNVQGNTFTCPADETTPWQSSNGIQAYWDGEVAAATQSKPQLQERNIKLNKLRALVPVTEELMEDASAIDSYLRKKAPQKILFKINYALIQGTGNGMPLGMLNAGGLVTVTKESGQVANTIVGNNILKMYNAMYGPSRTNAVWVYNQSIEPQLFKLSLPGTDNTGNAVTGWGGLLFYTPFNGINNTPYNSLMGRPAIPTQACPALSSAGDIMFVDFSQYLAVLKSGPNPKIETSMHLWFDQDLTAFKFTLRMGGMPWWSAAATALAGSSTYSPYVALGAR